MSLGNKPTEINRELGGAFALFGGYITGRQVDLVPKRANRPSLAGGKLDPGVYSIAKFDLVEQGSGTKLVFDHTGFPRGVAKNWRRAGKRTIGRPMEKLLA